MIQTTVQVSGMACSMCEAHVNDAVRSALNVKKVTSSHVKGETVILSDEPLDEGKLRETINATGYQVDAVLSRQRPGFRPHAPAVAAVTEVGKAQLPVSFLHPANPSFIHAPGMPGDRPLPVRAVQNHVNMTIAPHGETLPFRLSITDFGRLCKHGHFS